jgi:hypothetical protein
MPRRRIEFADEAFAIIETANEECRIEDIDNIGWTNAEVVEKITLSRKSGELLDAHRGAVYEDFWARLTSFYLGKNRDPIDALYEPLLPDLYLPEYWSIPPELDEDGKPMTKGGPKWKRSLDVTIAELRRLIGGRRVFVAGYNVETQKYVNVLLAAERCGGRAGDRLSDLDLLTGSLVSR